MYVGFHCIPLKTHITCALRLVHMSSLCNPNGPLTLHVGPTKIWHSVIYKCIVLLIWIACVVNKGHKCFCEWPIWLHIWLDAWTNCVADVVAGIHIYAAIHCNLTYMWQCHIVICTTACHLNTTCKCECEWAAWMHIWLDMWIVVGGPEVWPSIFTMQYIESIHRCQYLISFCVLLPVAQIKLTSGNVIGRSD